MRIRFLLVCVSAGLMVAASPSRHAAAPSDETPRRPTPGRTWSTPSAKDTSAPDVKDSAPPCDPTADFLKDIPDASIADGATTTGVCLGCAKTKCKTEIADCAKDCACQDIAGKALDCYAKGQAILKCAGQFASVPAATRNIGLALFGCVNNECTDRVRDVACVPTGRGVDADAGDARRADLEPRAAPSRG